MGIARIGILVILSRVYSLPFDILDTLGGDKLRVASSIRKSVLIKTSIMAMRDMFQIK